MIDAKRVGHIAESDCDRCCVVAGALAVVAVGWLRPHGRDRSAGCGANANAAENPYPHRLRRRRLKAASG